MDFMVWYRVVQCVKNFLWHKPKTKHILGSHTHTQTQDTTHAKTERQQMKQNVLLFRIKSIKSGAHTIQRRSPICRHKEGKKNVRDMEIEKKKKKKIMVFDAREHRPTNIIASNIEYVILWIHTMSKNDSFYRTRPDCWRFSAAALMEG